MRRGSRNDSSHPTGTTRSSGIGGGNVTVNVPARDLLAGDAKADAGMLRRALEEAGARITDPKSFNCPFHNDRNPSAGIYRTDSGVYRFKCLACDAAGDVFDIVQRIRGCSFPAARTEVLGWSAQGLVQTASRNGRGKKKVHRSLVDAERAVAFYITEQQKQTGRPVGADYVARWSYQDRDGSEVFREVRFETPSGKTVRPLHRVDGGWIVGKPSGVLPVYGLPATLEALETNPHTRVYAVEGCPCADALQQLSLVAITSGGSTSAKTADWTWLAGREVAVIPDNDTPGRKYADTVASILMSLDPPATVRVLDPLVTDIVGGDAVDFIERQGECVDVAGLIDERADRAETRRPETSAADVGDVERTKRAQGLSNFVLVQSADGKSEAAPVPLDQILSNLYILTGDWPRACSGTLFVASDVGIDWLATKKLSS